MSTEEIIKNMIIIFKPTIDSRINKTKKKINKIIKIIKK